MQKSKDQKFQIHRPKQVVFLFVQWNREGKKEMQWLNLPTMNWPRGDINKGRGGVKMRTSTPQSLYNRLPPSPPSLPPPSPFRLSSNRTRGTISTSPAVRYQSFFPRRTTTVMASSCSSSDGERGSTDGPDSAYHDDEGKRERFGVVDLFFRLGRWSLSEAKLAVGSCSSCRGLQKLLQNSVCDAYVCRVLRCPIELLWLHEFWRPLMNTPARCFA